VRGIEY